MYLSPQQKEQLIAYELAKCAEYFGKTIEEYSIKNNLLSSPNAPYTKVRIRIEEYPDVYFEKYYLLSEVKVQFLIDLITETPILSKKIRDFSLWGITYDIYFYTPSGEKNGGIVDFHINPDAWRIEFCKKNNIRQ